MQTNRMNSKINNKCCILFMTIAYKNVFFLEWNHYLNHLLGNLKTKNPIDPIDLIMYVRQSTFYVSAPIGVTIIEVTYLL